MGEKVKMIKKLTILFLLIPSLCYATPSMTTANKTSTTVSINGLSFGTKTQANPLTYDGFEDGACDTGADLGISWDTVNSLVINNTDLRNGNYNAKLDFTTNETAGVRSNSGYLSSKWYAEYWFKLDDNWDWGSSVYGGGNQFLANVKFFRMWNPVSIDENFVCATQYWGNTSTINTEYITPAFQTYWGSKPLMTTGVWHHFKFEYKENSALGAEDGEFRIWYDGAKVVEATNICTREDYSELKRVYILGFYNSWGTDAGSNLPDTFYFDDAYVDTTWARVEIGDNPDYNNCTHLEIQIPTQWSDTSITATYNQGSFEDNSQLYLFVIDEDGNASDGYLLQRKQRASITGAFAPTGSLTIT